MEDSDAAKFRQVMDVNVMSAVLVRVDAHAYSYCDTHGSARKKLSG